MGARGNATSIPMPWQEILRMLQEVDQEVENGVAPDLPHAGDTLVDWVQVLLKTIGRHIH